MKKYKNIALPIILILVAFSACKKDNSPISPVSVNSIIGLWKENFYGYPNMESVIKNDSGQYIIYKPDSILKSSQLKIEKDSFQVLVEQIYFLNGDILLENKNQSVGTYEIINDTISFTDKNRIEKYYYKLEEQYLKLIYVPVVQSGDSLIWISPDIGIPWGNSPFKYQGKFTRLN